MTERKDAVIAPKAIAAKAGVQQGVDDTPRSLKDAIRAALNQKGA